MQIVDILPSEVKRIVTTNEGGRPRRAPLHTQFVLFEFGGKTLKEYRRGIDVDVLPFTTLFCLASDIIAGLQHLEAHDMVHRDLKLDNILVDPSDKCQLVDFGLATRVDHETRTIKFRSGQACGGNIAHLAPEVLTMNSRAVHAGADTTFDMPYVRCVLVCAAVVVAVAVAVAVCGCGCVFGVHNVWRYPDAVFAATASRLCSHWACCSASWQSASIRCPTIQTSTVSTPPISSSTMTTSCHSQTSTLPRRWTCYAPWSRATQLRAPRSTR